MKRLFIAAFMSLIFCFSVSFISFGKECRDIRSSVLRLHILANSDSDEDQALKLRVRDKILKESESIFSDSSDLADAMDSANDNLSYLEKTAKDEIAAQGYDYDVSVRLEETYFTTRTYGNITLPAGNYTALRVVIGSGEGHNWWCVMFPQICISPSTNGAKLDDVLNEDQLAIVEGEGYEYRFKILEYLERLFG
ncbi:MAG: stage II sporulation protein R [Clostridia bacterium]|nr:stage II sporulation protein R [Clostridia bacterium]